MSDLSAAERYNMKKSKYLKAGLIAVFLLLTGIIYSCQRSGKEQPDSLLGTPLDTEDISLIESKDSAKDSEVKTTKSENIAKDSETAEINSKDIDKTVAEDTGKTEETAEQGNQISYVHICGAVVNPGVYEVKQETRIFEVIKLAGGFTEKAEENYINQAASVKDGEQIYIPTEEEVKEGSIKVPVDTSGAGETVTDNTQASKDNKININSAAKEELMTLPGIGEAKADSILDYRTTHGDFQSIEEVMNIVGIKEAVFNKMKDMIVVK